MARQHSMSFPIPMPAPIRLQATPPRASGRARPTTVGGRGPSPGGRTALRAVIVGAGPAGTVAALRLLAGGHRVTLLERRGRSAGGWVDTRTYNITVNRLGRDGLGESADLALASGRPIVGRSIHTARGRAPLNHAYGRSAGDGFVSIPRHEMVNALTAAAEASGADVRYGAEVVTADPDAGRVCWRTGGGRALAYRDADVVVFADGLNGVGRAAAARSATVSEFKGPDPVAYVKGTISAAEARAAGLAPDRIHFWPGPGGVSIGVPNADHSISVLVMAALAGPPNAVPFAAPADARAFLLARNRALLDAAPDLPNQLAGRRRGHFHHSWLSQVRVGRVGVLLGDASFVAPPWAGLGANKAMDDARALCDCLAGGPDLDAALNAYQQDRLVAADILRRLIHGHGVLLNVRLGSPAWRLVRWAEDRAERHLHRRSLYQRVCFEAGGFRRLIRDRVAGGST